MAVSTKHKISRMDRLYEDERGYDFIGRTSCGTASPPR